MPREHSIAEARSSLPRLVREAEAGRPVILTRRGRSVAVLVGRKQFEQAMKTPRGFTAAWDEFASEIDVAALDIDPDEIFGGARDRRPGRDVSL